MISKNIFNYKSSGNAGGLLLYRFAAEFDLKRLEEENTAAADLNSFCEVLETVSLGAVKTTCCICHRLITPSLLLGSLRFLKFPKTNPIIMIKYFRIIPTTVIILIGSCRVC